MLVKFRSRIRTLSAVLFLAAVTACSPDSGGHVVAADPCRPSGSGADVTVATYNIHAGVGRDGTRDLKRIAETLEGADVVGLQADLNLFASEYQDGFGQFFDAQLRVIAGTGPLCIAMQ